MNAEDTFLIYEKLSNVENSFPSLVAELCSAIGPDSGVPDIQQGSGLCSDAVHQRSRVQFLNIIVN